MSKLLLPNFSFPNLPDNIPVPCYIGKTTKHIIETNPIHKLSYIDKNDTDRLTIEIRLKDASLTCILYKDICIDARLFSDGDIVPQMKYANPSHLEK